jgi:hypothetical protein
MSILTPYTIFNDNYNTTVKGHMEWLTEEQILFPSLIEPGPWNVATSIEAETLNIEIL